MNKNVSKVRKKKLRQLQKILDDNQDAAPQGSAEWLDRRVESVGGSEISNFMTDIPGVKPYGTLRNLCENKLGLKSFRGNKYTRWGHLKEDITRLYTEIVFHTSVYETGALPGCIPYHHYSPDGLGVVDKEYLRPYVSKRVYKKLPSSCFVLFEYKNPFSRIPDGKIPGHYMTQVQTGLNDLVDTDIGIFIDMVIRCCSLDDLDWNNKYNKAYFNDPIEFGTPTAIGFIGIAEKIPEDLDDMDSETLDENFDYTKHEYHQSDIFERDIGEDYIDFGQTTDQNFDIMASGVVNKKYIPFYTLPTPGEFKFYTWLKKFDQFCEENGYRQIGLMPYKVFDAPIVSLEKDTNFITEHHIQQIEDFVLFVKANRHKSEEEKRAALDEKYPLKNRRSRVSNSLVQNLMQILKK